MSDPIALLYDDDAFVDALGRRQKVRPKTPAGLIGRQVAGREFLDAYLSYGTWNELVALVYNQESVNSLRNFFNSHPVSQQKKRNLRMVNGRQFHAEFLPNPPARLLFNPCPPKTGFSWVRQHGSPDGFAICGVTHSICDEKIIETLCAMITAPYESYDALICTSRAAVKMVKTVTDTYADYLRERFGGAPKLRPRLEHIPLGVAPDKFRPATAEERTAQRRALNIGDDEVAMLYVGRLLYHGKAHPFPMFEGIAQAANSLGKKVHLILAGWSEESVINAFRAGAAAFAPNIRLTIVDGLKARDRFAVWKAADVFTSLSDNIQETFGLSITEAMACGLPVIASDWNGYRDLVSDGKTGFLIPTYMVKDATRNLTSRFLGVEELNYDNFLAESNQTVAVDTLAAAEAYRRLISDAALRRRMGKAGRQRVLKHFAWHHVIKAYEKLWLEQEIERRAHVAKTPSIARKYPGPSLYPAPEYSFAGFPTRLLDGDVLLEAVNASHQKLEQLMALPLTNYASHSRTKKVNAITEVMREAAIPRTIAHLDAMWLRFGVPYVKGRNTVAWMLKYGLLRVLPRG